MKQSVFGGRRGIVIIVAALLLSASNGCGTVFNITGHEPWLMGPLPERPIDMFGGVDNDVLG